MSPLPATAFMAFSAHYDWTKAKRRRPEPSGQRESVKSADGGEILVSPMAEEQQELEATEQ